MNSKSRSDQPARIDARSSEAKRLLMQSFGDARPALIGKLLLLVFLISWSADVIFHGLLDARELLAVRLGPLHSRWLDLTPLVLLAGGVWFLRRQARKGAESFQLVVKNQSLGSHTDLALLISPVRRPPDVAAGELPEQLESINRLNCPDFAQWRMPLECLRAQLHHGELARLWLIGSADSGGVIGSAQQLEDFWRVARYYFPEQLEHVARPALRELEPAAHGGEWVDQDLPPSAFREGIDHGNIAQVARMVDRIRQHCRAHYKTDDLVVDVTGMTVTASIGAVIASLGFGQSFVYTSTTDYRVREYDMAYEPAEEDGAG